MHSNDSAFFVTQDQIGSSTLLTNVSGGVADCNAFYPFGEQDSSICATTNTTTHKFTGKERDSESNLDNFGARYYGSSIGRFMSPDPGPKILDNSQGLNGYTYGLNNPLRYVDDGGRTPRDRVKAASHFASMGIPYLWGGTNPLCGLDCSGLVQNVFMLDPENTIPALRKDLHSYTQAAELQEYGEYSTDIKDAQLGDAIFFASAGDRHIVHTGIVVDIRDGRLYFVDAPQSGARVRKDWIWVKGVKAGVWGSETFAGVGRPIEGPRPGTRPRLPNQVDPYLWVTLSEWVQNLIELTNQPIPVVTHTFCGPPGEPCLPWPL